MDQQYFVVEFAHSINGRFKLIHIGYKSLAYAALSLVLLSLLVFGLFSSYLRMSWKVAHYDQLRADFDHLRGRYQELQRVSRQHSEQIASLESLATEVSAAYGLNPAPPAVGNPPLSSTALDSDSVSLGAKESIEEYNSLIAASGTNILHRYAYHWQTHNQPSLWPVDGVICSSFGGRTDPFSGEGVFHTGVDLQASSGTPVRVTADGVVASAGWSGRYGKLIVVDHGNGLETYYAHLRQFLVVAGQEVRRGETIALSGGTGHVTGPHLHYEVRLAGNPVNPYKYLSKTQFAAQNAKPRHSDLDPGL